MRNGKFKTNYYKWKYIDEKHCETRIKAIDENWAVACNDYQIFLWNCHNQQQHLFPYRCSATYSSFEMLDSQPDQLPVFLTGSYYHMDIFVNDSKKRYLIKEDLGLDLDFKNYFTPLGKDKILTGKRMLTSKLLHL